MSSKKKVLLMGKSGSGKTSMRSIIFANYLARDTMRLSPTLDVEHSHVRFLGDLTLNLWDCGGQDAFYEKYFDSQRNHIFSKVELLIYIFDIESRNMEQDLEYYRSSVQALAEYSPEANLYILIHKMDLVPEAQRLNVFDQRKKVILSNADYFKPTFFMTSIWDETLYRAWSSIVHSLIPNAGLIEKQLDEFGKAVRATEVVLFERATFLVISHSTSREHKDDHRFEKISNIIKQFKLSCRYA